jgi:hypothetical protein
MIAIENSLGLWIPQVTGRYLNEDWAPENDGFGAQCWDTAANWSKYLGLPVISTDGQGRWPGWAGNMVDAFPQSPEIAAAYQLIGPDEPGLPGDIPVWGDGYYYYPKTHVAVLVKDLGGQLLCISQNSSASLPGNPYPQWTTGPTILQHLPRRGLIGFIRPRTGGLAAQGTITTEEGFLMALSDEEQRRILAASDRINGRVADVRVFNADDGAYMNGMRDAQYASVMDALGKKLDKNDGGYIVSLIEAVKPGATDAKAVADALAGIIPAGIAAEVADELAKRLVK